MLRWLKKHFIPHESNDHQPHFLRADNIRFLIFIVLTIQCIILLLPFIPIFDFTNNRFTAAVLPSVLDDLTNQNRQAQHLNTLKVSPLLNMVAELKARDMAEKGYFAHVSPEGKAPWYWFKQVGYNYEYAGENLAIDFTDSQDVTLAWMNSPTHRANIVKNVYTEVGTGVATGTYQGKTTIFVAQEYGRPASAIMNAPMTEPEKIVTKIKPPIKTLASSSAVTKKVLGTDTTVTATQTPTIVTSILKTDSPQTYSETNIFEKYATSPRHVANIVFGIIGIIIAIALILKLSIKIDKKHPILITNGLIVLILILGMYIANNAIAKSKMAATTSFVGFQSEQFK